MPALGQTQFDDFPTGFLRPATGGMPADAWKRHAARHGQAAGLGAARRAAQPGAARPAVQGDGERAGDARARRQPAAHPVRAQGRQARGHGRGREPERDGARGRRLRRSGDRRHDGQRADDGGREGGRLRHRPRASDDRAVRQARARRLRRRDPGVGQRARRSGAGLARPFEDPPAGVRPELDPAADHARAGRQPDAAAGPRASRSPSAARAGRSSRRRGSATSTGRRFATAWRCRRRWRGGRSSSRR